MNRYVTLLSFGSALFAACLMLSTPTLAFHVTVPSRPPPPPPSAVAQQPRRAEMARSAPHPLLTFSSTPPNRALQPRQLGTRLQHTSLSMCDPEEPKNNEELWRVVLYKDEAHTFNYFVRSLTKLIDTLDRKEAFEICVQMLGSGKATVSKTRKKQAEQVWLGLQRQGLTVSILPDEDCYNRRMVLRFLVNVSTSRVNHSAVTNVQCSC